ncbi:MAG: hypothetical protein IKB34_02330 [Clostridia bacterium]|nr:hypothetical protein [Clostridia bacterium]
MEKDMSKGKLMFPVGVITGLVIGGATGITVGLMTDRRSKIRKNAKRAMCTMSDFMDQVSDIAK